MNQEIQSQDDWIDIFLKFIQFLRIDSKEMQSEDDRGSVFNLWTSQKMFLKELAWGLSRGIRIFYVLKSRQLGVSTVSLAIDIFWLAMYPGTIGTLVLDKESNRETFRSVIKRYIASFPPNFFGSSFHIMKGGDNKYMMKFSNGSRLDFLVAGERKNTTWAESKGFVFGHLTEVSKYGDSRGLDSFKESMSTSHPHRLYIYESPLALDTPIATPNGWRTMGDMKEGHIVFNEEGKPCRVIGTSPVFTDRKCYKINFENGDNIVSDENHKWQIETMNVPHSQKWETKIVMTKDLDVKKHRIKLSKPLELPDSPLPIDPYFLGAWLGDGLTGQSAMVAGDEDIDEMRENIAAGGYNLSPISKNNWRVGKFTVLGQREKFIRLDLIGNKHIPEAYLRASEHQRRELLAGLMDTDGYINKLNFQCDFTSTLPSLLDSVEELLSSLGIKFKRSKHAMSDKIRTFPNGRSYKCSPSERLNFSERPECAVFKLKRKKNIQNSDRDYVWRKGKFLKIASLEEVESVPVKCISVDTPSHLFLAGRTMIPTHNTANGFNHWRDMWQEAGRDKLTIHRMFIGWWANDLNMIPKTDARFSIYGSDAPDEDEQAQIDWVFKHCGLKIKMTQLAWYRWRCSDTSVDMDSIHQLQPWNDEECFVKSGNSFFPMRVISDKIKDLSNNPPQFHGLKYWLGNDFYLGRMEEIVDQERIEEVELKIWEKPKEGHYYAIGMDAAQGRSDDSDANTIEVFDCFADKMVQVAEWCSTQEDTRQAAWVLAYVAGIYTNCRINVDVTGGYGVQIMNELDQLKQRMRSEMYSKLTAGRDWDDFLSNASWYLYHRPDSVGAGYAKNWVWSTKNKFWVMNSFRDSFGSNLLQLRSLALLNQMSMVVRDGMDIGSFVGSKGRQKDDLVFAAVLAEVAWKEWFRPMMINENYTYERVLQSESGDGTLMKNQMVQSIVDKFFREKEEAKEEFDGRPAWRVNLGLE